MEKDKLDNITREERSRIMRLVKQKNTKPELSVRSFLHKMGFRFRLHSKKLPGKPDIVLPKYKTVIEVRGCFWHRHKGCRRTILPKSNQDFWLEKFDKNVKRDCENERKLKTLGWKVIVIWECEIPNEAKLISRLASIMKPPSTK